MIPGFPIPALISIRPILISGSFETVDERESLWVPAGGWSFVDDAMNARTGNWLGRVNLVSGLSGEISGSVSLNYSQIPRLLDAAQWAVEFRVFQKAIQSNNNNSSTRELQIQNGGSTNVATVTNQTATYQEMTLTDVIDVSNSEIRIFGVSRRSSGTNFSLPAFDDWSLIFTPA